MGGAGGTWEIFTILSPPLSGLRVNIPRSLTRTYVPAEGAVCVSRHHHVLDGGVKSSSGSTAQIMVSAFDPVTHTAAKVWVASATELRQEISFGRCNEAASPRFCLVTARGVTPRWQRGRASRR